MIHFEDVSFTYPDAGSAALAEVSVAIPEGSFVLVAGPTGAGKSTLLRAVNGLVPQFTGGSFKGSVQVAGRDTMAGAPRDLADIVAFVPQDPAASFVVDRVEDELAYAMENLGVPAVSMRRRVEETLDLLGIEPLRERSVRTLSGGERQRVAIAASLTPGPRVLVLDEPTSQLDPQGAEDVLAALQRLVHDLGLTVLLAEHKLERVAGFVDLALGCDAGRVMMGEPAAIIEAVTAAPPVTRFGRLAGWSPLPLTVRDARRTAARMVPRSFAAASVPRRGPVFERDRRVLVSASRLRASYGSRVVLRGLDLELRDGEIVALMGRNGSGKSTLLRCLAGLHPPDSGSVLIGDAAPQPGHGVALCPQTPESILFKDTVAAEVRATIGWSGSGLEPVRLLKALGLDPVAGAHPRDLSAGRRLLVAIAATAATGAPVLMLDEPTRGLDGASKIALSSFIRSHVASDGACIFASHDVELAAELATRVVMLAGGEVIADGSPADVLGDSPVFAPQMSRVFGPGWLTPEQVWSNLRPHMPSAPAPQTAV
jgi:energy-coupling factor transport system ATP-binding protein